MELELGLKITRTKDDGSSSTDFQVSRDPSGQRWLSRETNSVFFLTLPLKGFKKEGIDIEINKEGNRIKISGKKQVEEMVLVKWVKWKKETEVKEFKKVFRIPEIVKLDKIKARFDEEDGTLTVTFPKKIKGITGLKIEEEEEEQEQEEITEEKPEPEPEEEKTEEKAEPEVEEIKEETKPEEVEEVQEVEEPEKEEEEEEEDEIEEEVSEEEETRDQEEVREEIKEEESKPRKKRRKKCCFPFVAGSTLLMSIIVFIIQLIQSKRK